MQADIRWADDGAEGSMRWRSERGAPPPRRVVVADDTLAADAAYRLACAGTSLLWRGDFQNARHLLDALIRRVDRAPRRKRGTSAADEVSAQAFHLHRQARAQRARILGALLIPLDADGRIALRRAPDVRAACAAAWGDEGPSAGPSVVSLRELLGVVGAFEWQRKGVAVGALGDTAADRIHPHYGVFSPLRGEYVDLVAQAPLPAALEDDSLAFDIGTGTGVLAALLARRGLERVFATDNDERALACARDNVARLGVGASVQVLHADLFPAGRAALVLCNPPWLPARPSAPIEAAIYDDGGRMLSAFLHGLGAHLLPGGEGWLILSDLAEHLGLRTRASLLGAIEDAGLVVVGRLDAKPRHAKAIAASDSLHRARSAEITSLWRLAAR